MNSVYLLTQIRETVRVANKYTKNNLSLSIDIRNASDEMSHSFNYSKL